MIFLIITFRMGLKQKIDHFSVHLLEAVVKTYGEDLITLALFGSWARLTATPVSDLDILLAAKNLPPSRGRRITSFEPVEAETADHRRNFWPDAAYPLELSPVIKTPPEIEAGSPLFLDMTENCILLYDQNDFFQHYLETLKTRMSRNGTRRVPAKGGYYWHYKPDAAPAEIVRL